MKDPTGLVNDAKRDPMQFAAYATINQRIVGRYPRKLHGLLFLLCLSCLTPIDFDVEHIGGRIVISGQISQLPGRNLIQVERTADELHLPFPISDAHVEVIDTEGNTIDYMRDSLVAGDYRSTITGVPGKTYFARVTLQNGQIYESMPETMPAESGSVTAYHTIVNEDIVDAEGTVLNLNNLKVYATTTLPVTAEPVYLKWAVEEAWLIIPTDFPDIFNAVPPNCYVTQAVDPQKIRLFNGEEARVSVIPDELLVSRRIDFSFYSRHNFTVLQSSLTRAAYEYWKKVDVVANQKGSIFDTPPAEIRGNIFSVGNSSAQVAGYFQAVNEATARFFLTQPDLPFRLPRYCEYDYTRDFYSYPAECVNCLSPRGSSYSRPENFGE
jgi:hypothetical protein